MGNDKHQLADTTANDSQAWLSNVLAEEGEWSGLSLWQLGTWAVVAICTLIAAFFAVHSPIKLHDQAAADDLLRQSQQVQWIAKEGQTETRRLSSALDTLNTDRDRLYARVTALEHGLDSVTGSVARQAAPPSLVMSSAVHPINPSASPAISAPFSTATEPSPSRVEAAIKPTTTEQKPVPTAASAAANPPDSASPKIVESLPLPPVVGTTLEKAGDPVVVSSLPDATETTKVEVPAQRTEFGVDLGGANSVEGLRALWQGVVKSNAPLVASLRPIIVIKERRNGLGMQLRLVAGPLSDAAAAAKICAGLAEGNRACETAVFDGQRLPLKVTVEDPADPAHAAARKRSGARHSRVEEAPPQPPAAQAAAPTGLFRNY